MFIFYYHDTTTRILTTTTSTTANSNNNNKIKSYPFSVTIISPSAVQCPGVPVQIPNQGQGMCEVRERERNAQHWTLASLCP